MSKNKNNNSGKRYDKDASDADKQAYWISELTAAKKSQVKWQERAKAINKRFIDERSGADSNKSKFNLFSANVGILQSACYARIPKPDISRRFKDADDQVGRVAALILERAITYELETDGYFDTTAKNIVLDRLVAGCGAGWVRYDVEQESTSVDRMNPSMESFQISDSADEQAFDDTASFYQEAPEDVITDEQTPIDYVHWNDLIWSPARTWDEVRFVARRVYMSEDAFADRFGDEMAANVSYQTGKGDTRANNGVKVENDIQEQVEVYEIWDKTCKTVIFFSFYSSVILDEKDDPLNLPGFFPTAKPLLANATTDRFMPTPDYILVQDQYEELDQINNRISKLVAAVKVVGVYNASAAGLKDLLQAGTENVMIPVQNWDAFWDKGGVKGQIDFLPITEVATVLGSLNSARDVIKAQIYELTGISDITRGVSQQYATATAEQIKSHYASMRLTVLQQSIAEYFSGLIQLKAHLMCKFYEPERLLARAGTLAKADQAYIQDAMMLLKNDGLTHFRLQISVDSLQLPDWNADKAAKTELLHGISQFLGQALPAAKETPELAPLMMKLLSFAVSGFKAADSIEGEIQDGLRQLQVAALQRASQPPAPPKPDPAQLALQQSQQRLEMENQHELLRGQAMQHQQQNQLTLDTQRAAHVHELAIMKMQSDDQNRQQELSIQMRKLEIEEAKLEVEKEKLELAKLQTVVSAHPNSLNM